MKIYKSRYISYTRLTLVIFMISFFIILTDKSIPIHLPYVWIPTLIVFLLSVIALWGVSNYFIFSKTEFVIKNTILRFFEIRYSFYDIERVAYIRETQHADTILVIYLKNGRKNSVALNRVRKKDLEEFYSNFKDKGVQLDKTVCEAFKSLR